MVQTKAELVQALEEGSIRLPAICKPLSLDGGVGIIKIEGCDPKARQASLDLIDYEPILVQDFIEGVDIGASIFCRDGQVEAFMAHSLLDGVFSTFSDYGIREHIETIAAKYKLTGVYNFDMRLTPDESVYYLECNPRIFHKLDYAMVAGINYVALGLGKIVSDKTVTVPSQRYHIVRNTIREALKLHAPSSQDLSFLRYNLADPISYARQVARLD